MYNTYGLLYRVFIPGIPLILFFVLSLLIILKGKKKKKKKTEVVFFLFEIVFTIGYTCFFAYNAYKPNIDFVEGYYLRFRQTSVVPFSHDFVFDIDNEELHPSFHMDNFSRKKIYPNEFSKKIKYRVYYEKNTKIIVKIEEIIE